MNSRTTARFRDQARKAYRLFKDNPEHPSLVFKQVHTVRAIYSARVLAIREEDTLIWFWIGSHTDYEKIISRL